MATCYLAIITAKAECAICGATVAAGLSGHSDDFPPLPICLACLAKNDPELIAVLILVESMRSVSALMDPDADHAQLAEEVRELLRLIRTCLPRRT